MQTDKIIEAIGKGITITFRPINNNDFVIRADKGIYHAAHHTSAHTCSMVLRNHIDYIVDKLIRMIEKEEMKR